MELYKLRNRRLESITLFVSLMLCLLVLFAYLNASALPSKALLNRAVAQPAVIPTSADSHEVGIPSDLVDTVRYFRTGGRSVQYPGLIESSVVIDRRSLQNEDESGFNREKFNKLFAWLSGENRPGSLTAEITCFINDQGEDLGTALYQRQQRCKALNIFNRTDIQPGFSARSVPAELTELATTKGMSIDDMILITLKKPDGRS